MPSSILPNRQCWTLAVAAASCQRPWHTAAVVTGIGGSPAFVAKLHLLESGLTIDYQRANAEDFAQSHQEHFSVITCLEMLEHVPDPPPSSKACFDMLAPGGHLFASTINRNPKSYLFAIIGAEYLLRLLPKGTHDYAKFIKPSELSSMARKAGFELDKISGMTYNPFTRKYKLGDDVDVNYLMYFRKPE